MSGVVCVERPMYGNMSSSRETRDQVEPRKLLTARQAADTLGVCEKTLWTITKQDKIPVVRIGRLVRYDPRDLDAFIAKAKIHGNTC